MRRQGGVKVDLGGGRSYLSTPAGQGRLGMAPHGEGAAWTHPCPDCSLFSLAGTLPTLLLLSVSSPTVRHHHLLTSALLPQPCEGQGLETA